ncbi:ankyrin repeat-containing domain protein [Dichotomocladium elegans]|nr:ankyrin repeat-containing domain protein [Dichotomocladium elegans]
MIQNEVRSSVSPGVETKQRRHSNDESNETRVQQQPRRRPGRPRKYRQPSSPSPTPPSTPRLTTTTATVRDPNKPDKAGRTKLFGFTASGDLATVKDLVQQGANVNYHDHAGWTPLHEASLKGQYHVAEYLIQAGANVNARGFGDDTPLHDASFHGYADLVHLLVSSGADVFALNSKKETPLDVCQDPSVAAILKAKIDHVNRLVVQDESGRTALHQACAAAETKDERGSSSADAVALLLKQGANVNAIADSNAWTPLHEAAHGGNFAAAKLLVHHGADIHHADRDGNTALHLASMGGHVELVEFLLDQGAQLERSNHSGQNAYQVTTCLTTRRILAAKMDELQKERVTSEAIDEITFQSHTELKRRQQKQNAAPSRPLSREERKIQAIMKTFASLEQTRPRRQRALTAEDDNNSDEGKTSTKRIKRRMSSAEPAHATTPPAIDTPRKPVTDVNKRDSSGRTSLHRASTRGDLLAVERLLEAGAKPNVRDNADYTPLHEAALRGRDKVAFLLLSKGADPNVEGTDKDTPLHDAAENGHIAVLRYLLKFGANAAPLNAHGRTPLDLALAAGQQEACNILREAMFTARATNQELRNNTTIATAAAAAPRKLDLKKKNLHFLQLSSKQTMSAENNGSGVSSANPQAHPIPTPPPERRKTEDENCPLPSLRDAVRYLPLYTVQLTHTSSTTTTTSNSTAFFVLDYQVSLLLGLSSQTFRQRYPQLLRRPVTKDEKERLWPPIGSMTGGCYEQAQKRRFVGADLYFIPLDQIVALVKQDYSHLMPSLMTLALDMGYSSPSPFITPATVTTATAMIPPETTIAPSLRRPSCGLPPKFALKMQKRNKLILSNNNSNDTHNHRHHNACINEKNGEIERK